MKREKADKKELEKYAEKSGIKFVVLYGSRARGTYKPGSDIDLTLAGGDDLDLSVLGRIMEEIDDLLLPYMFDLSLLSRISDPEVLGHIRRVGVVFYEKGRR